MIRTKGALFIDRDGIVNEDRGYVGEREDFVWQTGIFDLVAEGVALGLRPIVVTNQSGIARGFYTEAAYAALTDWMCTEFANRGMPLAAVYHCPWHPQAAVAAFRGDHPWRKPRPGMFFAAAADLGLDLTASVMVGDRWNDIAGAQAAGVPRRILVCGTMIGRKPANVEATDRVVDVVAAKASLARAFADE